MFAEKCYRSKMLNIIVLFHVTLMLFFVKSSLSLETDLNQTNSETTPRSRNHGSLKEPHTSLATPSQQKKRNENKKLERSYPPVMNIHNNFHFIIWTPSTSKLLYEEQNQTNQMELFGNLSELFKEESDKPLTDKRILIEAKAKNEIDPNHFQLRDMYSQIQNNMLHESKKQFNTSFLETDHKKLATVGEDNANLINKLYHKDKITNSYIIDTYLLDRVKSNFRTKIKHLDLSKREEKGIRKRRDVNVHRNLTVGPLKSVSSSEMFSNSYNARNIINSIFPDHFLPNKRFQGITRPFRPIILPDTSSNDIFPNSVFSPTIQVIPSHGSGSDSSFFNNPISTTSSFDDLSLSTNFAHNADKLDIPHRLGKLDNIFKALHVNSEVCRQRIMCEVSKDPEIYSPLSEILQHESRLSEDIRRNGKNLIRSQEGIRFLAYIDATTRGKESRSGCSIYKYKCRHSIRDLIDMDALAVWREVVGWLTVKVLTNGRNISKRG